MNDDDLGRLVREVWLKWAREQPSPKASWLLPWEELSEADRDVDRRIGRRLFQAGAGFALVVQRCPVHREPVGGGRVCIACDGGVF
jgi:hypothetical protein